jgi:FtsP/CotA-like multicopper oxidase with cupredoxin domain
MAAAFHSAGASAAPADTQGAVHCIRPAVGSAVGEPKDLRSMNGELHVSLTIYNEGGAGRASRYCYLLEDGTESPTLRLHPGDLLVLKLKNGLSDPQSGAGADSSAHAGHAIAGSADPCLSGAMTSISTNLHFHGLSVPSLCHQDEVLKTSIQPGDAPFEYRFRIPANQPPGLYWYHPHIHGFSTRQSLGGASGALVVEGLERVNPAVAGLPERVLVIRDQDLQNPDAPPSNAEPVVPKPTFDFDGDAVNNNTGFGKPAKDLSINYVPVPYPDYLPASIKIKPGERQLWRVLNASAITYLHLALLFDHIPQQLGVVAIDGVSINISGPDAKPVAWVDHIGVPPGGRVEFIVTGPREGEAGVFMTRSVDTGSAGDNDPNRALATLTAEAAASEPQSALPTAHRPMKTSSLPWIGNVEPVRVRKLYFSEVQSEPGNPQSKTTFYITVDGEQPVPFDPAATLPNITVNQGDVEDWIIENRSLELHAFHIHQIHFLLLNWFGLAVNEPFLRDTVNVPYFDNHMTEYPSVRLRMDFRDPNTLGTFVYHCHLLEHEDGGMMGTIRVKAADGAGPVVSSSSAALRKAARGGTDR